MFKILTLLILKVIEQPCPSSPDLGLYRGLKVPDQGIAFDPNLYMVTGL